MEELLRAAKDRPEVAWDTSFAEGDGSDLPPVLRAVAARDRRYQAVRERIAQIATERLAVKVAPPTWKATVGVAIDAQLAQSEAELRRAGGERVLELTSRASSKLDDLMTQAELIRFEIGEARRKDYEERATSPDPDRKAGEQKKKPGP
jgi:hypothetical protein